MPLRQLCLRCFGIGRVIGAKQVGPPHQGPAGACGHGIQPWRILRQSGAGGDVPAAIGQRSAPGHQRRAADRPRPRHVAQGARRAGTRNRKAQPQPRQPKEIAEGSQQDQSAPLPRSFCAASEASGVTSTKLSSTISRPTRSRRARSCAGGAAPAHRGLLGLTTTARSAPASASALCTCAPASPARPRPRHVRYRSAPAPALAPACATGAQAGWRLARPTAPQIGAVVP